jgi:hypothetical protein
MGPDRAVAGHAAGGATQSLRVSAILVGALHPRDSQLSVRYDTTIVCFFRVIAGGMLCTDQSCRCTGCHPGQVINENYMYDASHDSRRTFPQPQGDDRQDADGPYICEALHCV